MHIGLSLIPEFELLYNEFADTKVGTALLDIEGISPKKLDMGLSSHSFFEEKLSDITIDANSNIVDSGLNPTTYRTFITDSQMKLLGYHLLWYSAKKRYGRAFADKAIRMIWNGDLYFHDAHGLKIQMPYCFAFSLDKLVIEGRPYGTSPNSPPKHRKSFISQVDKLISDMSKQFAGATAPSDFFLWYAWFCKKEGLDPTNEHDVKEIVQDLQGLVCLFNDASRSEGESPFTNLSIYDDAGLHSLFDHIYYPDFTKPDFDYIKQLQKIYCEWFSHGDPLTGFPYRFPVTTQNLTTDDAGNFIDMEAAKWVAHVNRRMGNFNLHFGKHGKLAMCCRYENDLDDMDVTPDSFGNGGVNIGSHRVITPNYGRAALLAHGDINKFYEILDDYFDVSAKLLDVHRNEILQHRIDKNPQYLMFFGKLKWFNLKTMFSTFGVEGINEAVEFMGNNITDEDGTEAGLDLMAYIKSKCKQYRKEYGVTFNAEEIPGEQACVSLLKKDKLKIDTNDLEPDVADTFNNLDLYSNQYIPLTSNADIVTRIDLSGRFMHMISGGGIVHVNVDSPIDSDGKMLEIMKFAAKSGVPHMAICYRYGKCPIHKATTIGQGNANDYKCPVCGEPIVHTRARVIGYFSDEFTWNPVRREHDAPNRHYGSKEELKEFD